MSSQYFKQYLSAADLKMLDGVLENAGMRNYDQDDRQAIRMSAARFLIGRFQHGDTSPAVLFEQLKSADFAERVVKP